MKLEFININKYFNDFHVLKDVTFAVNSGQIFGYLGRNGAGKTTSIRVLMDVFQANSGTILLDGQPFDRQSHTIGYLAEERGMYSKATVRDQLVYFAMLRGATRPKALESVRYWTEKFGVDIYLDRKLETLSKGNQQKVQITQAFLNEPEILILDEPFSGLDPVNAQVFKDALKDYIATDRIIIFSSHQMAYVEEFCDDIAIIDNGSIVLNGNLDAIKTARGHDTVRLVLDGVSKDELATILDIEPENVVVNRNAYIVHTQGKVGKKAMLLRLLERDITICLFEDFRPSLQDIFVESVGR